MYFGESNNIFSRFKQELINLFTNFNSLDLIYSTLVNCKAWGKDFQITIRKSLIQEKPSENTIPLVYVHSGHALILMVY